MPETTPLYRSLGGCFQTIWRPGEAAPSTAVGVGCRIFQSGEGRSGATVHWNREARSQFGGEMCWWQSLEAHLKTTPHRELCPRTLCSSRSREGNVGGLFLRFGLVPLSYLGEYQQATNSKRLMQHLRHLHGAVLYCTILPLFSLSDK